jgi:hypothetical protein
MNNFRRNKQGRIFADSIETSAVFTQQRRKDHDMKLSCILQEQTPDWGKIEDGTTVSILMMRKNDVRFRYTVRNPINITDKKFFGHPGTMISWRSRIGLCVSTALVSFWGPYRAGSRNGNRLEIR